MRIILFLLKCVVGVLATVGLLVVLAVVGAVVFWERADEVVRPARVAVPDSAVLVLNVADGIVERRPRGPFGLPSLERSQPLPQLLAKLDAAAEDERVQGLLLHVGRGSLGLAQMQELRQAVARFRDSGKFAVAFAETFGEGGNGTLHYYLATAAESVWLQPSGDLDISGFLIDMPFAEAALGEIGVRARFGARGEYKGAVSSFTERSLPEPQRENLQRLVDSWIQQIARGLGEGRGLTAVEARNLVDRAPFSANEGLDRKLVDRLGYWDEVADAVIERAGPDSQLLDLADYRPRPGPAPIEGKAVALIHGLGPVLLSQSEDDPLVQREVMASDRIAEAVAAASEDPEIAAILFRIDSPGGSYVGSDVIWRELTRAREAGKLVVVSMGNVAASGGYFVAAPADVIVAQPGTVTGSIGVVSGKFVLNGLWDDLEINWDAVQAGRNADLWSPNRDFTPEGWSRLQQSLDRTYDDFVDKVARGRDLPRDQVIGAAEGQVWSGEDAQSLGLVDELGGLWRAQEIIRERIGLPPAAELELRPFPEVEQPFERLLSQTLGGELAGPGARRLLLRLARLAELLGPLLELAPAQGLEAEPAALRLPPLRSDALGSSPQAR